MDINNAKDYLPFVQALAEGKTIQMWNECDRTWNDMKCNIGFDCDPELYRIKPETTKWWIMPKYTPLHDGENYNRYGPCYYVAEQEDGYSKSCPPLESGFDSKEEAEKWLNIYLLKESVFQTAAERFEIFSAFMSNHADRFKHHKPLDKDYLEFKVHEFLEDVDKMDESIWIKKEGE